MTNQQKLETLKGFLRENNIPFKENHQRKEWLLDLYISKYQIGVRISKDDDQKFFEATKHYLHPLFIRDKETAEFVVEKMQNLLIDLMKIKNRLHQRKLAKKEAEK